MDSILEASGLSRRDLFAGPPLSKGQIDELAAKRQAEEEKKSAERAMIRSTEHLAIGQLRQLDLAVNFLGGQLMVHPDDDSLALSFDQVLQEFRRVESIASHLGVRVDWRYRWIEPPAFIDRYNPMAEIAHVFFGRHSIPTRERKDLA